MVYIVLIIALLIIFYIINRINFFTMLRNKFKQSKSSIDVYLNQRFDLVPNLVEIVKGYTAYESSVYENIVKLRNEYNKEKDTNLDKAIEINKECNKIFAVAENLPELKASEQFLELQKNLVRIENNLQATRRLFNGDVTLYNNAISTFPNNIIAMIFGFKKENLFEIEEYKKENTKLDL